MTKPPLMRLGFDFIISEILVASELPDKSDLSIVFFGLIIGDYPTIEAELLTLSKSYKN